MQIIDLLRKLIAQEKSEREIGNLAAAETFAAKAQELLTKHKLDMTEVEFAEEEANEPVIGECIDSNDLLGIPAKSKNDRWHSVLISTIAAANFCKVLSGKSNNFVVVGRESDRLAVKALFTYLAQACNEMAQHECRSAPRAISIFGYDAPRGRSGANRSFVNSFKVGFACAINTRLQAKRQELKAGAQEQGLIRIDQMERATAKAFKDLFPNTVSGAPVSCRYNAGYQAGKRYGSAIGINSTARLGV